MEDELARLLCIGLQKEKGNYRSLRPLTWHQKRVWKITKKISSKLGRSTGFTFYVLRFTRIVAKWFSNTVRKKYLERRYEKQKRKLAWIWQFTEAVLSLKGSYDTPNIYHFPMLCMRSRTRFEDIHIRYWPLESSVPMTIRPPYYITQKRSLWLWLKATCIKQDWKKNKT